MKEIKRDKSIAQDEALRERQREEEKQRYQKAMDKFRSSPAHKYVMEHFRKAEENIIGEIEQMQLRDMRKVFMLSDKEKREKIDEMSKRDAILSGVLAVLKQVKSKL